MGLCVQDPSLAVAFSESLARELGLEAKLS